MAVGRIATSVLTDIANAIRQQNGGVSKYRPAELAAAVAALDGTKQGDALVAEYPEIAEGLVPERVLADIAAAIRKQNGQDEKYRPGEMAAAILALSWKMVAKPRAMLFEDGWFELNYVDAVPTGHGAPRGVWDLKLDGYASDSERPWHAMRQEVKQASIDYTLSDKGVKSAAYWFANMGNLEYVNSFGTLRGVEDTTRMFSGCTTLYSISTSGVFDSSTITKSTAMFDSCYRLVGQRGYVPTSSDNANALNAGENGVLSFDGPTYMLTWTKGYLFDDGEVVITKESPNRPGRTVVASSQICADARYRSILAMPWGRNAKSVKKVTLEKVYESNFGAWNMNYWFYGCSELENVGGLAPFKFVGELMHSFNACTKLASVDLRGLSPENLKSLFYTFAGCKALKTILVDASWKLPEGIDWGGMAGSQTFMGCSALVGGAGTAWDAKKVSGAMAVADAEGMPGYLTAG